MIIRELEIKNFGKLKNRRLVLKEGINLVYGENESGKSTLYAYLKGMLFGLPRMRGRASRKDNYIRYEPWENPCRYGGSLRFSCGLKDFALYRNFHKDYQEAVLLCESDGEQLRVEDGDLDILLGEISEAVYENTAAVGQIKTVPGKTLAEEVKRYLLNYETGRDGDLDLKEAETYLKAEKKERKEKSREEKQKLMEKRVKVTPRMEYLEEEIGQFERQYHRLEKETAEKGSAAGVRKKDSRVWKAGGGIAVLTLLLCWFLPGMGKGIVVLLGILAELFCIFLWLRQRNPRVGKTEEKREREKKAVWKRADLLEQKKEKEILLSNYREEYQEILEEESRKNIWEEEEEAINLALETMQNLAKTMQKKTSAKLQARTEEILSDLTNGKYGKLLIDGDLNIRLYTQEKWTDLEQVSRGTIEQVYFALRMAVSETFEEGEGLPVILDESFAMYDEERLNSALIWLYRCGRQVILLTCQKREEECLNKLEIPHQFLTL